jgi:hypothetical protein
MGVLMAGKSVDVSVDYWDGNWVVLMVDVLVELMAVELVVEMDVCWVEQLAV